jgi:hypothetical protein
MNVRSPLFVCAIVAGCAAMGLSVGRPAPAQAPAPTKGEGRYQMLVTGTSSSAALYVIDTQTGQCWSRNPHVRTDWTDLGTPAKKAP